ncbi:MAG TPA: NAD(P)/FAD-dependent oxidoreductase [Anaerolineae bacterium]|nr:NAD(P)/FAD-dependent oxidoreductase [Anaerolineae bacterium]HQH40049.1 NAD(P)/FAD-dependent oxidoreductase [Anaerolineae bacterium]
MQPYDIIIIGAGVVGAMVARTLSRYALDILWIEKASDICMGATAANSAIIHGGYDAMPGSLKAQMNIAGNAMWDRLAAELQFPFARTGTYVVAIGAEELAALDELKQRGDIGGVPTEIISGEEMRRREPSINPAVSGALYCPTGGVCDPWAVTIAAAENAVMNGVELRLNTTFEDFIWEGEAAQHPQSKIIGIKTNQGDFYGRWVVNAAGLYADEVMHKAGVHPEFHITPRRGEYYVLDRARVQINNVLFPVPSKVSKGILVTTTLHGNPLVGPNAEEIDDKTDVAVTAEGMHEIWEGAQKLVPGLNQREVIALFAGLRPGGNAPCLTCATPYNKDFLIEIPTDVAGFVNLGGLESPALSAAPAIAERVVTLLQGAGEALCDKSNWNPIRPARPVFRHLNREAQAALIARDPRYGRVICRCETVTEGEIVAEIHAPIPATTYDAIKRRTWLGTGRCLGGFDMPRVVDILARELGISPLAVSKKGTGSEFLYRTTKA